VNSNYRVRPANHVAAPLIDPSALPAEYRTKHAAWMYDEIGTGKRENGKVVVSARCTPMSSSETVTALMKTASLGSQGDKSIGWPRRSNKMKTFESTISPTGCPRQGTDDE
jgi:hypothetical protein